MGQNKQTKTSSLTLLGPISLCLVSPISSPQVHIFLRDFWVFILWNKPTYIQHSTWGEAFLSIPVGVSVTTITSPLCPSRLCMKLFVISQLLYVSKFQFFSLDDLKKNILLFWSIYLGCYSSQLPACLRISGAPIIIGRLGCRNQLRDLFFLNKLHVKINF